MGASPPRVWPRSAGIGWPGCCRWLRFSGCLKRSGSGYGRRCRITSARPCVRRHASHCDCCCAVIHSRWSRRGEQSCSSPDAGRALPLICPTPLLKTLHRSVDRSERVLQPPRLTMSNTELDKTEFNRELESLTKMRTSRRTIYCTSCCRSTACHGAGMDRDKSRMYTPIAGQRRQIGGLWGVL